MACCFSGHLFFPLEIAYDLSVTKMTHGELLSSIIIEKLLNLTLFYWSEQFLINNINFYSSERLIVLGNYCTFIIESASSIIILNFSTKKN